MAGVRHLPGRVFGARPLHQHRPASASEHAAADLLDDRLHARQLSEGRVDAEVVDDVVVRPGGRILSVGADVGPELVAPGGERLGLDQPLEDEESLTLEAVDLRGVERAHDGKGNPRAQPAARAGLWTVRRRSFFAPRRSGPRARRKRGEIQQRRRRGPRRARRQPCPLQTGPDRGRIGQGGDDSQATLSRRKTNEFPTDFICERKQT